MMVEKGTRIIFPNIPQTQPKFLILLFKLHPGLIGSLVIHLMEPFFKKTKFYIILVCMKVLLKLNTAKKHRVFSHNSGD